MDHVTFGSSNPYGMQNFAAMAKTEAGQACQKAQDLAEGLMDDGVQFNVVLNLNQSELQKFGYADYKLILDTAKEWGEENSHYLYREEKGMFFESFSCLSGFIENSSLSADDRASLQREISDFQATIKS